MDIRKSNFLRFLGYVRPYVGYLLAGVAGGVIKFTVPLLVPLVTRHLLDDVFLNEALSSGEKLRQLLMWTGGMAAVFLFVYAPGVFVRHQFADRASHRAVFDLRCDLYYRILRMSASFFSRNKTGAIITRLISDVQLAQNLIGTALTNIWMDGVAVIAVLVFLFRIDVWTTLVALSTFPLYLFFFRRFSTEIRTVSRQVQEELSVMSSNAHERISGNVVVRAFTRERTERRRFNAESERLFSTNMRRIRVQSLNQAVTGTLMGLSPLVVIAFGGWRVVRGDISVGDLMAATMYLAPLYLPLQRFSELNIVFANGMAALDRIYEIMDEKPEIRSAPNAVELTRARGRVEFDHVSFGYGGGRLVLHDVTFVAEPGEKVALVGASGSGKTTLVSLIPRFYDVSAGAIRVDGWDVRRLRVRSLRQHVSMVLQDPILFSGTIRENILYGNPEADDAAVEAAAEAANALEFISRLPNGFDTEVGERGAFLSGGQRQRITIARAFLKDPRILIFDEATSSLDSESEHLIQNAMGRLVAGRTTFIIAHRLSTVLEADRIIVLSGGRIVEAGSHRELMGLDGAYRNFYMRQLEMMDAVSN
ncbi:MAG TPA: ABC transporter ATP-binding protein [Anaerohalosphaeraceae bacterium]|nr:ABC transporter ATP-binding protein [Anaerohalosphaeraceae bacterium]HRT48846.1 ABC transporter ATP-binding protein [Anaerohalosphaeraceae bacterium]HRT84969.1 ABC transporter ATP-binding protein [Anaerohalosphaeraceae bacterium]